MRGVLILAHGSRVEATKKTINEVVDMVRSKISDMPIQIAYMEFCESNMASRPWLIKGLRKLKQCLTFSLRASISKKISPMKSARF